MVAALMLLLLEIRRSLVYSILKLLVKISSLAGGTVPVTLRLTLPEALEETCLGLVLDKSRLFFMPRDRTIIALGVGDLVLEPRARRRQFRAQLLRRGLRVLFPTAVVIGISESPTVIFLHKGRLGSSPPRGEVGHGPTSLLA